jgi:protein-disulfide isomerase
VNITSIQFNYLHSQTDDEFLLGRAVAVNNSLIPILGNPLANITVIEFGDYQCAHCADFNKNQKDLLIKNYSQSRLARFYFKDYTINDLSNGMSTLAARASYCASDQHKFWQFHDQIFRDFDNRQFGKIQKTDLDAYAKLIGISNLTKFKSCLDSDKYSDLVKESNILARLFKMVGTPTFLVYHTNNPMVMKVVNGITSHKQLEGNNLLKIASAMTK